MRIPPGLALTSPVRTHRPPPTRPPTHPLPRLKDTDLAGEEEASFARLDKDGNGSLSVADLRQVRGCGRKGRDGAGARGGGQSPCQSMAWGAQAALELGEDIPMEKIREMIKVTSTLRALASNIPVPVPFPKWVGTA
jgi:hypothetical protein